jgi:hypothetical protein
MSTSFRSRFAVAATAAATVASIAAALFGADAAAGATVATRSAVPALSTVKTAAPGFKAAFWSPYFVNGTANIDAQIAKGMAAQKAAGDTDVIIEWSVHYDAKDTAYPASASIGLPQWNDAVPRLVAAAKKAGLHVWMGLAVAPTSVGTVSTVTNQSWLNTFAAFDQKLSNDLYAKYGSSISGWYLPTEPAQVNVATPTRAAQFGSMLGAVSDYLHTHNGKKPVMVSPSMPTAILSNLSATAFVSELAPVIQRSHVDVLNLQDGFEMTAWTPAQEVAAFAAAKKLTDANRMVLWAAVYTPVRDGNGLVSVAKMTPYLKALGAAGIPLTQWEFASYMTPDTSRTDGTQMVANYKAYMAYLGLTY